ncbi:hypothetical protein KIW84_015029 [Lathyrus oleraceus]|uniref:Uncharacterized protein n=1 Tax=Pisum sativum TaxID=3888 RepID=A0A9D5BP69_PEA|nr:hypothetical protein KIW84_015029 [Pisum sativum]
MANPRLQPSAGTAIRNSPLSTTLPLLSTTDKPHFYKRTNTHFRRRLPSQPNSLPPPLQPPSSSLSFTFQQTIQNGWLRYAIHCTWVIGEAYSFPSIVLVARGVHSQRFMFDNHRKAYFCFRQKTPPDAKVMSWWDYGYQVAAMGNRIVIVDNNA